MTCSSLDTIWVYTGKLSKLLITKIILIITNNKLRYNPNGVYSSAGGSTLNSKMYGIIVLALFPFAAFFACGYFFAKHRHGYTKAPTKETEMSQVSHTAV